jgi:predicted enzyme related to lactoylglutathione lyase
MPRVVHFEIHADQLERAVAFYQRVFDWDVQRWEGSTDYWLVTTGPEEGPGINGAIMPRVHGGSTYNTIDVPSVDEFAERIIEAGGEVVMPRTPVPGVGYMAYCSDTEGNVFGIMEVDETAE